MQRYTPSMVLDGRGVVEVDMGIGLEPADVYGESDDLDNSFTW